MFKLGRRGLFLVTVMLFLAGGHQTCAAAGFTILYQDPDSIHFSYDYYYTNNTYYNYMLEEVRIEHELPNGAKEVIASAQATVAPDHSSASPITLKGSRNLQGQAAGKHLFRLIEKTRDSLYASTYTEKKIELNETDAGVAGPGNAADRRNGQRRRLTPARSGQPDPSRRTQADAERAKHSGQRRGFGLRPDRVSERRDDPAHGFRTAVQPILPHIA